MLTDAAGLVRLVLSRLGDRHPADGVAEAGRSPVVSGQDKVLATVLYGAVTGELIDFLMFKANLAGTLLHDDESALELLVRAGRP
ncbi:hypothetical protein [Nonomuraea sp. 10N515B]|uniref:hypothetical protein n=1 Tax=Nonomuraea sp. 10N515B TaxID=3457422 RepID=UPI003FCD5AE3